MRIITEIKVIDNMAQDVSQEELDKHARQVYSLMKDEVDERSIVIVDVYREKETIN